MTTRPPPKPASTSRTVKAPVGAVLVPVLDQSGHGCRVEVGVEREDEEVSIEIPRTPIAEAVSQLPSRPRNAMSRLPGPEDPGFEYRPAWRHRSGTSLATDDNHECLIASAATTGRKPFPRYRGGLSPFVGVAVRAPPKPESVAAPVAFNGGYRTG